MILKFKWIETHTNKIKITDDIELEFRYPVLDDMIELETHESEIEKTFFFLEKLHSKYYIWR